MRSAIPKGTVVVLRANEKQTLAEMAIYPREFVENADDIVSPSTKEVLVRAKSQLAVIGISHGSFLPRSKAYCTYRDVAKSSQRPLPVKVTSNKLVCVADTDEDGRLDALSNCWAHYPDLLMDLFCNKPIESIDVAYHKPEANTYSTNARLKLEYSGYNSFTLEVGASEGKRIFYTKPTGFTKLVSGDRIRIFDQYAKISQIASKSYRIEFDEAIGPAEITLVPEWSFLD